MRNNLTRQRRALLSLALTLTLLAGLTGCKKQPAATPGQPVDNLRVVAVQIDRTAKALDAVFDLKRALYREGLITQAQSAALTAQVSNIAAITKQIQEATLTYATFAEGKAHLSTLFGQLRGAFDDLSARFLPTLSQTARSRIDVALNLATAAVSVLTPILQGGS